MEYKFIKMEKADEVGVVTINRPEKLNALNGETLEELKQAFLDLAGDAEVRAVILTGAGEKAFVAGADIQELSTLSAREGRETSRKGQELTLQMERFPKPLIGAVNGFALGGGLEIAMACHLRTASIKARFGLPEVTLGLIPGYGGTQRLPRLVGKGRALEMILSGSMIDAQEAHRIGLVNKVIEPEELLNQTKELAKKMTQNGPLALAMALESVERGYEMSLSESLNLEADLFGMCCTTEDMREGTGAFLEKRKANFQAK